MILNSYSLPTVCCFYAAAWAGSVYIIFANSDDFFSLHTVEDNVGWLITRYNFLVLLGGFSAAN